MIHYTHPYLLNPVHKVTIDLVGMGGTGSQVLSGLARMNEALMKLGHPGIHVRAWDSDTVTDANMGRQLFCGSDIGHHKSVVLITRVNRFFGTEWEARVEKYSAKQYSNILITCVDTAKARVMFAEKFKAIKHKAEPTDVPYYWLDIGNLKTTGQVVLGTMSKIWQPKTKGVSTRSALPNVVKKFPQLKKLKEVDQGPSCSLAEALEKQDLFINSTLAQFGCNLIWKLFRDGSSIFGFATSFLATSFFGSGFFLDSLLFTPSFSTS